MNWWQIFSRAEILEKDKDYLLRIPPYNQNIPVFIQVRLVGFSTCPAIVVVQDGRKRRFPCDRTTLYDVNDGRN